MKKPTFFISCPIDTYSGYGARSRDLVKAIIELDKFDVKIMPQRWGETPWNFCTDHKEWSFLNKHFIHKLEYQPDIWMQVSIPNEFQPVGKFNIGCTAGMETNVCNQEWIQGLNRMNFNIVSSNHSKHVFNDSVWKEVHKQTRQEMMVKLDKPLEVLFEGFDTDKFKVVKGKDIKEIKLTELQESFAFLFVGHFIAGNDKVNDDRKNVHGLIKSFLENFKGKKKKPALILKMSGSGASYTDRYRMLEKIDQVKKEVGGDNLPNIYLLHSELSDEEINELYNHPRVKAMISLTRGEGFGRPLLEFTQSKKPIIASGWSGHTDFLDKELSILLPGKLKKLDRTSVNKWFIEDAQWFDVDLNAAKMAMNSVYNDYDNWLIKAKKQGTLNKENFSFDKMKDRILEIFTNQNVPLEVASKVKFQVPTLKKKDDGIKKLPKLKLPTIKPTSGNE